MQIATFQVVKATAITSMETISMAAIGLTLLNKRWMTICKRLKDKKFKIREKSMKNPSLSSNKKLTLLHKRKKMILIDCSTLLTIPCPPPVQSPCPPPSPPSNHQPQSKPRLTAVSQLLNFNQSIPKFFRPQPNPKNPPLATSIQTTSRTYPINVNVYA